MPDQPTYVHKLEAILAEARSPKPIPFFRRRDIEALFGLKKRQTVNLMHRVGAVRVSNELAVAQRDLVRWLEEMVLNPTVAIEQRRHDAVIGRIVETQGGNRCPRGQDRPTRWTLGRNPGGRFLSTWVADRLLRQRAATA